MLSFPLKFFHAPCELFSRVGHSRVAKSVLCSLTMNVPVSCVGAELGIPALPKAYFVRWQGKCPFQARDSAFAVQPWTEMGW